MDALSSIGSFNPIPLAARPASTPAREPADSVQIGTPQDGERPARLDLPARDLAAPEESRPQPAIAPALPTAPEPKAPPVPSRLPRPALHALCARAEVVGRALASRTLSPRDFGAMAEELVRIARASDDPVLERTVEPWLLGCVQWNDSVTDWCNKLGPLEGATAFVNRVKGRLDNDHSRTWFNDTDTLSRFLDVLQSVPPDEGALRAVAHFAHVMQQRSDKPLEPEIRARETPEMDRAAADDCASLVYTWWLEGRIEVRHDGATVPVGRLDLPSLVKSERVAVRGTTIDIESPLEPTERGRESAEALVKSIDPYPRKEDQGKPLDLSALKSSEHADETVEALVAMLRPHADRRYDLRQRAIGRVLDGAASDPELRAILAPHAEGFRTVASRAAARDLLATSNLVGEQHVALAEAYARAFPEQVDLAFVRDELAPMLLTDEPNTQNAACKMIERLWERRPDLVGPVADLLTSGDAAEMRAEQWSLLLEAADRHGWKPSQEQVEWVAGNLLVPTGPGKDHTFFRGRVAYDGFGRALDLLMKVRERDPHALDGLTLPDGKGGSAPLGRAVLERILRDESDEMCRNLYTRGTSADPWRIMSRVYRFVFPDPDLTKRLLDTVDAAVAGDLRKIPAEAQSALVVLGSLDLAPADDERFLGILRRVERIDHQWYWFNEIVDRVRRADLERGGETLASGALAPADAVDLACGLMSMARIGTSSFDLARKLEPIGGSLERGLKDPAARAAVVELLAARASQGLAATGRIADMSADEVSALQALEHLSREDEATLRRFEDALQPALAVDQGWTQGVAESLFKSFRLNREDACLRRLREDTLSREERIEMFEEAVTVGALAEDSQARDRALASLETGLSRTPLASMAGTLRDRENVRRLAELFPGETAARQAEHWPGFKEILDWVNGEPKIDDAVSVWTYVNEVVPQGRDRDQAIQHALRCLALGVDPRNAEYESEKPSTDRTVERRLRTVRIAGVDVPVRD